MRRLCDYCENVKLMVLDQRRGDKQHKRRGQHTRDPNVNPTENELLLLKVVKD